MIFSEKIIDCVKESKMNQQMTGTTNDVKQILEDHIGRDCSSIVIQNLKAMIDGDTQWQMLKFDINEFNSEVHDSLDEMEIHFTCEICAHPSLSYEVGVICGSCQHKMWPIRKHFSLFHIGRLPREWSERPRYEYVTKRIEV